MIAENPIGDWNSYYGKVTTTEAFTADTQGEDRITPQIFNFFNNYYVEFFPCKFCLFSTS